MNVRPFSVINHVSRYHLTLINRVCLTPTLFLEESELTSRSLIRIFNQLSLLLIRLRLGKMQINLLFHSACTTFVGS